MKRNLDQRSLNVSTVAGKDQEINIQQKHFLALMVIWKKKKNSILFMSYNKETMVIFTWIISTMCKVSCLEVEVFVSFWHVSVNAEVWSSNKKSMFILKWWQLLKGITNGNSYYLNI